MVAVNGCIDNLSLAKAVIAQISAIGVTELVLCSGNRNTPFIAAACSAEGLKLFHHFSERSAAFFALGRIKTHGKPVAVIVTSGTAAVELHPACVEAYYSGLPLILVTADRPRRYRGSGAPQSIDQKNLFGSAAIQSFDIAALSELPTELASDNGPLHLNVSFEEPLLNEAPSSWAPPACTSSASTTSRRNSPELISFLKESKSPLVILGRLEPSERARVQEFLLELGAPIYAEALSGLRESVKLSALIIKSGELTLKEFNFDACLRIGSIPTTGLWRDLERDPVLCKVPLLSLSSQSFSGVARPSTVLNLKEIELTAAIPSATRPCQLLAQEPARVSRLQNLLDSLPKSEAAIFRRLSRKIPTQALLYLGNSLPIREWDLCATREPNLRSYEANRGANGIDGQLSTFLGCVSAQSENWCILGDLTTLYDMEAPFILPQLPADAKIRIVVINNAGGRLFDLLPEYQRYFQDKPGAAAFIQPHQLSLEPLAKMWSLDYLHWNAAVPENEALPQRCLIEIVPDLEQSAEFWKNQLR